MHDFFHDVTMKNAAFMRKLTRKKEKIMKSKGKIKKIMQKWKKITIVSMLMVSILCVQVMEALADTPAPVQVSTWEDLVAAVSASSEGDVIELMDAITVPCGVGLNATGRITLKRGNAQGSLSIDWNIMDDRLNSFENITFDGGDMDATEPILTICATTQVTNCEFKNCKSMNGTVCINSGQVTFTGCSFKDNSGNTGSHMMVQTDKKVTITNCSFTGGQSANHGGALYMALSNCDVEISGSTITGNSATNVGGGIFNRGTLTITGSKVFGNTADKGADIYSATPVTTETMLTDLETIYADENIIVKGWLTESNALGEVFMKLDYENKPEPTEPPSDDPGQDEPSTEAPGDDSGSGNSGASGDGTPSEPSQNPSDAPSTPSGNDSPGQSTETPSEAPGTTETPSSGGGSGQQSGNTDNSSSQVDNSSSSTTNDSHNTNTTSDSHNSNDNNSVTTTDSHNTSTTDTSDRSTTTTDSSSHRSTTDNSKTTTKNDNRSYTYHYDAPASPVSKETGAGDTIIINEDKTSPGASQEVLEASSEAANSVPESKDPSNNISIDAEGVNVSFKVVDGVYSIDIKGNGGQTPGQVQEVVQQESPAKESKVNVYEIIKIVLLAALVVNMLWKPKMKHAYSQSTE